MNVYIYRNSETLTMYYEACYYQKVMDLDYNILEEPEVAKLRTNTWRILQNKYGIRSAVSVVPAILTGLLGMVWTKSKSGQRGYSYVSYSSYNAQFMDDSEATQKASCVP